jgi:hypothetical protein
MCVIVGRKLNIEISNTDISKLVRLNNPGKTISRPGYRFLLKTGRRPLEVLFMNRFPGLKEYNHHLLFLALSKLIKPVLRYFHQINYS